MAADPLLSWRKEFPILQKTVYMISNSLGAMPSGVERDLQGYAEAWATRGVRAWEDSWWEMSVTVGDQVAPLIGANPREITMQPNVTLAEALVLSCFEFRAPRNKIVLDTMNFPSVLYLYSQQVKNGARLEWVKSEDGVSIPLEKLLAAIDETTLLVPISHVLFRSAYIQNVEAIVHRAHEVGAFVVLDVYQSAGVVPLDVKTLNVDFVIGGCLKWLCGGPGNAFLYVRPDLREKLEPRITGWMAHENPFGFELPPTRLRKDVFRFLHGTPTIPCLYAAREGLRIINAVGVQMIREKSMHQTAKLCELAAEHGWKVTAPKNPAERGGTVAVDCPRSYEVSQELLRREFLVDWRPSAGIRLSPHFYNSDDELKLTIHEIKKILDSQFGSAKTSQAKLAP